MKASRVGRWRALPGVAAGLGAAALFGAGRHACVGKQISLSIWRHLSEQFNDRKIRGTITDYQSESTHTFNFVRTLKVSIQP